MSLPLLVIMVPVFFGLMGFALDLGRLYLIRGELNEAANAMALAAASQLNGSGAVDTAVNNVMPSPVGTGPGYNYYFGSVPVGQGSGNLGSTINPPLCYATVTDALGGNNQTDCASAQFVQVSVTADAPLLFWTLLPGGQSGKTTVAAQATAGISAPLCTACGTTPFGIADQSAGADPINFGLDSSYSTIYTLYYSCTGTAPSPLAGPLLPYVLLNRYDTNNSTLSETDQLYEQGAQGIVATANPTANACTANTNTPLACINFQDIEQIESEAAPGSCTATASAPPVLAALCGLDARIDTGTPPGNCQTGVTDWTALSAYYTADTDPGYYQAYSSYQGDGRRIITVAVVNPLASDTTCNSGMTVVGFAQFLIEPNPDGSFTDPTDANGRFSALYIGSPAPVQQGWFDNRYASACPASGPGKVVLHQ